MTDFHDLMKKLAEMLIIKETLDYDQFEALFKENVPPSELPVKTVFPEMLKTISGATVTPPENIGPKSNQPPEPNL
jgi:hypothetical protein